MKLSLRGLPKLPKLPTSNKEPEHVREQIMNSGRDKIYSEQQQISLFE